MANNILPFAEFYLPRRKTERVYMTVFNPVFVDHFYDLMEICYDCVFQQQINPRTGHPYVQNAAISVQSYVPYKDGTESIHISPARNEGDNLLRKYEFIILSGLDKKIEISMYDPLESPAYCSCQVKYHLQPPPVPDPLTGVPLRAKIHHDYYHTMQFSVIQFIPQEQLKSVFKIWMNVPKTPSGKDEAERDFVIRRVRFEIGMRNINDDYIKKTEALGLATHPRAGPGGWGASLFSTRELFQMIIEPVRKEMENELLSSVLT